MNSQSEQSKTSLEKLVEKNAESLSVMAEPYMTTMVPVQEKHWDTMVSLLRQTVEFQPKLLQVLRGLATRAELSDTLESQKEAALYEMQETAGSMVAQSKLLATENENIRLSIQNQLSQDGKNREQFFKDMKEEVSRAMAQIVQNSKQMMNRPLTRKAKIWFWILGISAVLYPVLSVLLWGWLLR